MLRMSFAPTFKAKLLLVIQKPMNAHVSCPLHLDRVAS
jgi:hypothetical protein